MHPFSRNQGVSNLYFLDGAGGGGKGPGGPPIPHIVQSGGKKDFGSSFSGIGCGLFVLILIIFI